VPHKKPSTPVVKVIPPTEAEARDEGQRLLPLERQQQPDSKLEHYMNLAKIALGKSMKS
jgi:hypothetical protein